MMRALLFLSTLGLAVAAEPVDLLLVGGNLHTLEAAQPRATALAIRDGRIAWVGDDAGAAPFRAAARRVIDLRGATVVPGLNDAHLHLASIGAREVAFDLEGTAGVADLQARVAARVATAAPKQWIVGRGWIETHWPEKRFPTRHDLDAIAPAHPVILTRADGHALVANSLALRLAGVDRDTPAPTGGDILREPDGAPAGLLVDNAMRLVRRLVPEPTPAEVERHLILGAERELRLGWTGGQNAGHSYAHAELLRRLVADGKVKLRIHDAVSGSDGSAERLLAAGPVIGESAGRYTRRTIKLYMDGALGSRGAALLAPYSDEPRTSGLLLQDPEKFATVLRAALRRGVQIETHAIGYRGNRAVLDAYAAAFAAVPAEERRVVEPRWRIEHAQILHPDDLPRFAALGVIASMQPSHAIGDLFFAPARLGPERLVGAYAGNRSSVPGRCSRSAPMRRSNAASR